VVVVGCDAREDKGGMAETVIRFQAAVYKVQTMAQDYTIRLTLDMPETAIPQMAMLAECQREGIPLVFEAKLDEPQKRKISGDDQQRSRKRKVSTGE
jgi:hypothetical protein